MRREDALSRMLFTGRENFNNDAVESALRQMRPGTPRYVPSGMLSVADEQSMVGDMLGSSFGGGPVPPEALIQMRQLLRSEGFGREALQMSDEEVMRLAQDYVPRLMR